ncbi:hypothetical protein BK708_11850 [Bacillus thuringiensis serovar yunnanensis]|nr:hypothetical protein BK708_11850 [Bacillus thuringiensis serovar yunnanensis]
MNWLWTRNGRKGSVAKSSPCFTTLKEIETAHALYKKTGVLNQTSVFRRTVNYKKYLSLHNY